MFKRMKKVFHLREKKVYFVECYVRSSKERLQKNGTQKIYLLILIMFQIILYIASDSVYFII